MLHNTVIIVVIFVGIIIMYYFIFITAVLLFILDDIKYMLLCVCVVKFLLYLLFRGTWYKRVSI